MRLDEVCPKELQVRFHSDATAVTRQRASDKARVRVQADPEAWTAPWWQLITNLLRGKRINALQKHIIQQVAGGVYICGETLARWGYETEGLCEACEAELDSVYHRCFVCWCRLCRRC